ncbi:MAG: histidinol-phosphate transaminase [Ardenticatenia bacterium]|nr:MAG: histidinol-phosphate transaminase [Ardenticatenia bacterium]
MSFDVTALIRPDVASMQPYVPILPFEVLSAQLGRPPEQITKLDANENPYGPSPKVRQALAAMPYPHIYPDPESRLLRAALSDYVQLPMEYLLAGHGADELIDLVMRLLLQPGDVIVNCPPTFGIYPFDAAVNGARVCNVPRRADFTLDVEAIIQAVQHEPRCKLVIVTSPNNPDGGLISDEAIDQLLRLPVVVVLDEAYVEFAGLEHSHIHLVPHHDNLVVLRSFSKWAGLAGLRLGYGAFPLKLVEHLWKIKQPYNVNVAAQVAGIASLEDREYLLDNVRRLVAERERMMGLLRTIPYLQPYPSYANFILCKVLGRDAFEIKQKLAGRGILIRYYHTPGLTDHVRFTVGRPKDTERLIQALREL